MRERLRPYIHDQMRLASRTGLPPMRPLFVDYPGDPDCWAVDDQMMFGPDILTAPVYAPGQPEREVYLPAGRNWTDPVTGQTFPGGITVSAVTPLERIPVFVTEGSAMATVICG